MAKIFISYSRRDKRRVKRIVSILHEEYGYEQVWCDENFYGGQVWWQEILKEIADCHIFVYMMSPRSLTSPYCLAELDEARRLRKHILPVKLRSGTQVPDALAKLHYVDLTGAITSGTMAPLRRAINELLGRPASTLPPISETPVPMPQVPPREPRSCLREIATGLFVAIVSGLILALLSQPPCNSILASALCPPTPTPTNTPRPTDTPSATPTPTNTPTPTDTSSATPTPGLTRDLALVPTLSAFEQLQTAQIQLTETAAQATLLALSWTPTPRPTNTPLPPTLPPTLTPSNTPTYPPTATFTLTATSLPTATRRPTVIPTRIIPTNTHIPTITPTSTPTCPSLNSVFAATWNEIQDRIGCAQGSAITGLVVSENFQYGMMFWREPIDYAQAIVLFNNGTWRIYQHPPFVEGSPEFPCADANTPAQSPPTPKRGFGSMWCNIPEIRMGLGNATDAERGYQGHMQEFSRGFMIRDDLSNDYIFYSNGLWERRTR